MRRTILSPPGPNSKLGTGLAAYEMKGSLELKVPDITSRIRLNVHEHGTAIPPPLSCYLLCHPVVVSCYQARYLLIDHSFTFRQKYQFLPTFVLRPCSAIMHFFFLSALAGVAVAAQPKLLFGRQDYTVSPSGLVDCADEFICGIYCRPSNYFCCSDGSRM